MKFLDPVDVLKQFGVYGTQDVADVGTGSGHFALCAAGRLDGGRLFAVDIEKDMLSRLVSEAKNHGHKNIHPVWGDAGRIKGIPLADMSVDKVIASNILFQIDDRDAFAQEIKRILKTGGKVLVIDWKPARTAESSRSGREEEGFGPHKHHRLSCDSACAFFTRHGFKKEKDVDVGDYHYGTILVRD